MIKLATRRRFSVRLVRSHNLQCVITITIDLVLQLDQNAILPKGLEDGCLYPSLYPVFPMIFGGLSQRRLKRRWLAEHLSLLEIISRSRCRQQHRPPITFRVTNCLIRTLVSVLMQASNLNSLSLFNSLFLGTSSPCLTLQPLAIATDTSPGFINYESVLWNIARAFRVSVPLVSWKPL